MNDRAISGVLEKYDMEVMRTMKGRGTIVCQSEDGYRVLKEYKGRTDKLELLDKMQKSMEGSIRTDKLIRNKEGELFCKDTDGIVYILKEHIEGRECSYRSEEDIRQAFAVMAKLHLIMTRAGQQEGFEADFQLPVRNLYWQEMNKHTRECRHIQNYLRHLKSKTDFERELLHRYDYFLEKAQHITDLAAQEKEDQYCERIRQAGCYYHGDYQYHNVIFDRNDICVINMERLGKDSGVKDLYLLFRKISEKADWSLGLGTKMIEAYERIRPLEDWERRQLAYRLAYPDKFWKIVNFYYNSRKSRIPDKTVEKLDILVAQEKSRQRLIQVLFGEP